MEFGQPHAVQTHLFGRVDHSETFLKRLGFVDPVPITEFHECAKMHKELHYLLRLGQAQTVTSSLGNVTFTR